MRTPRGNLGKIALALAYVFTPLIASAHPGHDNADGLHDRIVFGAAILGLTVITAAVMALARKRVE